MDAPAAPEQKMQQPSSRIGSEIRALRRAKKMSTAVLSKQAGVSVGMISQIERGISNPSIRILTQISEALNVPMSALLEENEAMIRAAAPALPKEDRAAPDERDIIRRVNNRPNFFVGTSMFYKEILSPSGDGKMQMMLIAMPPGSVSDDMVYGPGEKAGFVMEGTLTLEVAGVTHQLLPGDSFQFDASQPHCIYNRTSETVKLYWIISLAKSGHF